MKNGADWENRIAWTMACLLTGAAFIIFFAAARGAAGTSILPLDDAYIHLQYARQLAAGQPFVYNPGEAPTSGATSLIYPVFLALGAVLGLRDLSLGIWAMGVGGIAFAISILLAYRIARLRAQLIFAFGAALIFGLSGLFSWHAMSGMETMLATCFSLALLYGFASKRRGWIVWTGGMLALTRPEGAVGAVLASAWLIWDWLHVRVSSHDHARGVPTSAAIPLLAIGVQPLVNLLVTGSAAATGAQAKSLLNALAPIDVILDRVAGNFFRMWGEWLLPPDSRYGSVLLPLLAVVALLSMIWGRWFVTGTRSAKSTNCDAPPPASASDVSPDAAVVVLLWLLGTSVLVSTLDTAFWHFRRYQIPALALFFPLAAWGASALVRSLKGRAQILVLGVLCLVWGFMGISAMVAYGRWVNAYALNVGYVAAQPLAMANWLSDNTAEDVIVAVHDVGMMRFHGDRETLDMVGLTTRGAAVSWRQGPGAVGEWLVRNRPDLIAAYGEGHGLGLNYLQDTDLYAETLGSYSVQLESDENVALAAATQGIYRPRWETSDAADLPRQESLRQYYDVMGVELVDSIDVADLADEAMHSYEWYDGQSAVGFPTEFFQFDALDCLQTCVVADGGRRIGNQESFRVATQPGQALLLVTRVQAAHPGEIDVYADGALAGTRVVPFLPGEWYEMITFVPPERVDGDTRIQIVSRIADGDYMPYQHWVYQSQTSYAFPVSSDRPQALYQDAHFSLNRVDMVQDGSQLAVTFHWMNGLQIESQARGDYFAFAHVYGDPDAPPVAQLDMRPANGTLPPGNWLPGMLIDTFMLDLSTVPSGRYRVAVGLYDPYSFSRLVPALSPEAQSTFEAAPDGRLWVGEIALEHRG